jgi:hypothetical protein
MTEKNIQSAIMQAVSEAGGVLFRNNQGTGVTGQIIKSPDGFYVKHGRVVQFGVCNPGGSDLIGWQSVTVTPDMIGKKIAVFVALEVKTPTGKPTPEQMNFIRQVRAAGGFGGIVRNPDEAVGVCNPLY